jgi:DNA-binding response OmpR family regulator
MSALIVLVNADPRALRHAEATLSDEGYLVAAVGTVVEARKVIDSASPDLVIADLRLGADNGLELAIRTRVDHPGVPVIITHDGEDVAAEADATHYGATFIVEPLANPRFLPRVQAALEQRRSAQMPIRRWPRTAAAGVVDVIVADGHARIVDMSGGGVLLALTPSNRLIPEAFTMTLPADVLVHARRVWTARSPADDQCRCGAQVSAASEDLWRQFVSSLRQSTAA